MTDPVHWSTAAMWDDESLAWDGTGGRVRTALVDLGDPDATTRSLVMLVEYLPDIVVPAHWHTSDYVSIVLQGSVRVSGREHAPGSIRHVAAGTAYGPLVAGPTGTRLVDVFADRDGAFPQYLRSGPDDDERVAAIHAALRRRLDALPARPRLRGRT